MKISTLQGHAQRAQTAEHAQQAQQAQQAQHAQMEELLEQQARELKETKSQVVTQQLAQDTSSAEKVCSFEIVAAAVLLTHVISQADSLQVESKR